MAFRREGDDIYLKLTADQYDMVLVALGMAAGLAARENHPKGYRCWLRVADEINEGNPQWQPYNVPED